MTIFFFSVLILAAVAAAIYEWHLDGYRSVPTAPVRREESGDHWQ